MSEREPREDRVIPPEHVHLYKAPGMDTVSFAELMIGFGIRRDLSEWMESINQQLASVMAEVAELRARIPGQVEPQPQAEEEPHPRPRRK